MSFLHWLITNYQREENISSFNRQNWFLGIAWLNLCSKSISRLIESSHFFLFPPKLMIIWALSSFRDMSNSKRKSEKIEDNFLFQFQLQFLNTIDIQSLCFKDWYKWEVFSPFLSYRNCCHGITGNNSRKNWMHWLKNLRLKLVRTRNNQHQI
jgi:hypothetical protein